jgi:hypothetical protein
MARYSLKQAAEAAGKAKSSIHRDIKSGKLSAAKDEHGRVWIDAAELHRVYPAKRSTEHPVEQAGNGPGGTKLALLEQEVEHLKAMLEREKDACRDLARRLDAEAEERRRLTALLVHQAEPVRPASEVSAPAGQGQEAPGGILGKLFGWRGT